MRIREMSAEDYGALCALWEEAGLPYRPKGRDAPERIRREIDGSCSVFLVAEEGGRLIGGVLGTHDGRKGWINRLVVAPDRQRQGVASALVAEVERRLAEIGIEIVTCLVEAWNDRSMAFFEALGYVRHDDIHYYSKRRDPSV